MVCQTFFIFKGVITFATFKFRFSCNWIGHLFWVLLVLNIFLLDLGCLFQFDACRQFQILELFTDINIIIIHNFFFNNFGINYFNSVSSSIVHFFIFNLFLDIGVFLEQRNHNWIVVLGISFAFSEMIPFTMKTQNMRCT